jgi:hypothetical protein
MTTRESHRSIAAYKKAAGNSQPFFIAFLSRSPRQFVGTTSKSDFALAKPL